jgi:hypothetical protein
MRVVDMSRTHLETLVLEHTLDGRIFPAWRQLCMEDNAKGSIADYLALCVGELSRLSSQAILDLFADDFCSTVSK